MYLSPASLVKLYKSKVLSFVEYATPAICHAPPFFLKRLDAIQTRFLSEAGISDERAIRELKLAPLSCRRDIAMMGLIHRTILGKGPAQFRQYIHTMDAPQFPRSLRASALRHNRQLHDPMDGTQSNSLRRSLLSLIYAYNLLPQRVVDSKTVSAFQRQLQSATLRACQDGILDWKYLFQAGIRQTSVEAFQQLFATH